MTTVSDKYLNTLVSDKKQITEQNITGMYKLVTPNEILHKIPISNEIKEFVLEKRKQVNNILNKKNNRKICIVGPCSIHDIDQAKEYGRLLKTISDAVKDKILIIMRVYFEKPRTTVGWKGLINDPDLDNTFNINKGLYKARELLYYLNNIGVPCAYEVLDTYTPQYISDLITWGAIGARTTESQVHRQMISGCSFPVGFKNSRTGDVEVAAEAVISAAHPHCFYGTTYSGRSAICHTKGNENCHIILRGGKNGPNYKLPELIKTINVLNNKGLKPNIMVDCSHGNSGKDYTKQKEVLKYLCNTAMMRKNQDSVIIGLMIESNLNEGKQKLIFGEKDKLKYGVSITDSCISIEETERLMLELYDRL
jgi:3-deoxy-7-phosphoheptulonate synthase